MLTLLFLRVTGTLGAQKLFWHIFGSKRRNPISLWIILEVSTMRTEVKKVLGRKLSNFYKDKEITTQEKSGLVIERVSNYLGPRWNLFQFFSSEVSRIFHRRGREVGTLSIYHPTVHYLLSLHCGLKQHLHSMTNNKGVIQRWHQDHRERIWHYYAPQWKQTPSLFYGPAETFHLICTTTLKNAGRAKSTFTHARSKTRGS